MNRCWLCTSFLTSHKIDCGVVAMVTKIAKMGCGCYGNKNCQNGVSVGGDSRVGDNTCACFFLLFFKPSRASKVNQRSRLISKET